MNFPRQPFIGLALVAVTGIGVADFIPIPQSQWSIWIVGFGLIAFVLFWEPTFLLTYLLVGSAFFLLHNFHTRDTAGLRLATELTERPRVVRAVGFVTSEPKIVLNGLAAFLFKLESIEL